jgi:hypothetical protein
VNRVLDLGDVRIEVSRVASAGQRRRSRPGAQG